MKLNKMWRSLLEDWPIKVFSLLMAISVFVVVNYATLDSRTVEIPLHVTMPDGYEATSTIPESVSLLIRADERYIGMIDPTAIKAIADFSVVSEDGVTGVPVLLEAHTSYVDIEVSFSTDPDIVRVFFQKKGQSDSVGEEVNAGGTN
ncbi:hypothetical protein [Pleomorphochaeta sp. DL1XJH-081]|jgi:hypothetical protein|uniref:hypothetical protein n=1 Tax=Pleomorphochaeta sp. DL1XJH-081 TaxID=3409690 RepID=UPI003BB6BA5F